MKVSERRAALVQLWLQRPEDKRTGNDVLIFYGWLREHRPELLKRGYSDRPYQHLQAELSIHIRE